MFLPRYNLLPRPTLVHFEEVELVWLALISQKPDPNPNSSLNCDDNNSSNFYMPFGDFTTLLAPCLCRTQTNCGALLMATFVASCFCHWRHGGLTCSGQKLNPILFPGIRPRTIFSHQSGTSRAWAIFRFHGVRRQNGVACCREMFVKNCSNGSYCNGSKLRLPYVEE